MGPFAATDYSRQQSVLFSPHAPLRADGGYCVVQPSSDLILWEVDVQVDFLHPSGNLYVPGAEKIIPNIQRLVDVVRRNGALLISSGDKHSPDDPEF
jgi:hypothetical protein